MAVLFIIGAIVVNVVRDEGSSDAAEETTETTETTEEPGEATPPGSGRGALPRAFVVTRSRSQPTIVSTDYVKVVSLPLDPGSYQVFGKLGMANRFSIPFKVECTLAPGDSGGALLPEDAALDSDYAEVYLGPAGEAGGSGDLAFAMSRILDAPGSVVLACRGYGHEYGAFGHYASIRAVEVSSIEQTEAPVP